MRPWKSVDQVELDLHSRHGFVELEPLLAQHPREHVEAAVHLVAIALAVLAGEGSAAYLLAHRPTLPESGARGTQVAEPGRRCGVLGARGPWGGDEPPPDIAEEGRHVLGESFEAALAGARRGDDVAFALLYRDIQPALLRYLRVMSIELAEDAASETWLEVARGLDGFQGPEPAFRGWLFAIARRKLIDRVRYEARRPSSAWDDLDDVGPRQRDVAEHVVELDDTERALALVRTLPPDQAEAVLLRVVAGLDYAAVAEVMGRSSGAVRVLVHRGLKRLGRDLGDRVVGPRGVTP